MMRKINSPIFPVLLGLGVALVLVSVPIAAPSANPISVSTCWLSAEQPKTDNGSTSSEDTATFTGKITQSGGKLVLEDTDHMATYQLDDQNKAKSFEGKSVKITGTLDVATNTIHVSEIEPLA